MLNTLWEIYDDHFLNFTQAILVNWVEWNNLLPGDAHFLQFMQAALINTVVVSYKNSKMWVHA